MATVASRDKRRLEKFEPLHMDSTAGDIPKCVMVGLIRSSAGKVVRIAKHPSRVANLSEL